LTRALDKIRNDEVYNIDVIAEAGLGTIWTTVCATGTGYFDDTKTAPDIEALRTSGDLTNTNARDYYNTIFNQFNVFCGPTKDGGRGDVLLVADPIRQILVTGKDNKIINTQGKNFSTDIYWAMRHQFENSNTSYSTAYANYMKVYDNYSGLYIYVPPSGFVAAKMASTDADQGPWVAPAGFNRGIINDALDLAFAPNQRQRDELYKVNLNPITRFPDQGIVIFGQKTLLKKPSAFDRVNVRRNFLYLEKATKSVMKFFLFENNTLFTRTRVVNTLKPFFERVKQSDGLYDYLIVCDSRNNTPEVIDNNELVVDIYLKPVKSAEFILVNFYATRTDTNFQELAGG
jgi:phage tail sheath protein FI